MTSPEVTLKPTIDVYLTFNGYKWIAHSPDRRETVTTYPHPGPRDAVDDFAKQVTGQDKNTVVRITPKHYRLILNHQPSTT